ncbi:MAG: dTMP kinase [bacterium]
MLPTQFLTNTPPPHKGKLIVIEGLDGVGKHTQTTLLHQKLHDRGTKTELISFPQYDTPVGKLIAAYLQGEIGDKKDHPPEVAALFFALDRYQVKWQIEQRIQEDYVVILDRYSPSNLAFQGAKIENNFERETFLTWLNHVESNLPKPDLIFYLHLPLHNMKQWIAQREQRPFETTSLKDIHERDFQYQQQVQQLYLTLAHQYNWRVISYEERKDKIKSREDVQKEIWEIVENSL